MRCAVRRRPRCLVGPRASSLITLPCGLVLGVLNLKHTGHVQSDKVRVWQCAKVRLDCAQLGRCVGLTVVDVNDDEFVRPADLIPPLDRMTRVDTSNLPKRRPETPATLIDLSTHVAARLQRLGLAKRVQLRIVR